jgi:hypothetical protein
MMWTSVLLILGVAYMASGFDKEGAKEKVFEYRVRNQQLHIESLEEEIGKLEEEYEKLTPLPEKDHIAELKARVRNLEHNDCEKRHTPCHNDPAHCVNDLHVCDGHDDCPNGGDEDEHTCSVEAVTAGRSYVGRATWESCIVHEPHNVIITIAATKRSEFFGPRVWVRAVVTLETNEHSHLVKSFIAKGYWSFGRRLLALAPDENTPQAYAIACKFNLGDNNHADCKILERVSLHTCAKFRAANL